jgi:hypothetical protein
MCVRNFRTCRRIFIKRPMRTTGNSSTGTEIINIVPETPVLSHRNLTCSPNFDKVGLRPLNTNILGGSCPPPPRKLVIHRNKMLVTEHME